MKRKRRVGEVGCAIVGMLVLCGLAGLAFFVVVLVPGQVEGYFGPPSPQLGGMQRIVLALQLFSSRDTLLKPNAGDELEQEFGIRTGESANSVAERLVQAGLVRDSDSFRNYLVYSGLDTSIQAGNYKLSPQMTAVEIAQALQDATPQEVEFNILAGWRAEEIAQALPTSGLAISPEEFMEIIRHPSADILPAGLAVPGSLDGYLLPGSYQVARGATAPELVRLFLDQFNQQLSEEIRAAFTARGLALNQAITLASMVQREAVRPEEQATIASVFYNRLETGMKLESDPTVQYALGYNAAKQTWWTNPLSSEDLGFDSPYNTYRITKLPPGPICNPSLAALKAVAYPAQTPYYFFRAACDHSGRHNFGKTFDEHVQNACP